VTERNASVAAPGAADLVASWFKRSLFCSSVALTLMRRGSYALSGAKRPAGAARVGYRFQFGVVFAHLDELLLGAWYTVQLSASAMVLGLAIGIAGAMARTQGPRPLRVVARIYVEAIRNTPFLVQLFIIFFGLPGLGLKLSPLAAALVAMVINLGAYSTEIVRAGIESTQKGQIEAGLSLGLSRGLIFRHVVLLPALKAVYPALASQFVLLMLASSVVSQISAEELTFVAQFQQSRNYRSFEIYTVVMFLYLGLAFAFRGAFFLLYRAIFARYDS
jgi:polar amino acid transport system permease protein